jgi:N-acetyl-gamma-glutamyl-phosphate reductase
MTNKIRVAVLGATGYTALELFKRLLRHPNVDLTAATSRQEAGQPLASVHPLLAGRTDLRISNADPQSIAQSSDVAFCCLPHGASAESVKSLREVDLRVIDLSADFRLGSFELYKQHYGDHHAWPESVGKVVYGLSELFANELRDAPLIANPGCYPTTAILPLAPLLKESLIEADDIVIDSKSGVSGAGRSPKLGTLYCEVNESISAYSVGVHRHQPEIVDILHRATGIATEVHFTPHLTPMDRGMLSTIYVRTQCSEADVLDCWRRFYRGQPFIRIVDHLPATKYVVETNYCDLAVRRSGKRLVLLAAIDNLVKGASGAAIQNLNLSFGWDQTLGL